MFTSFALLVSLTLPVADSDEPLTKAEFTKIHQQIVPTKLERWQKIPWRIDFLAARTEAFKERKPIFLWAMNGHPLGCT